MINDKLYLIGRIDEGVGARERERGNSVTPVVVTAGNRKRQVCEGLLTHSPYPRHQASMRRTTMGKEVVVNATEDQKTTRQLALLFISLAFLLSHVISATTLPRIHVFTY